MQYHEHDSLLQNKLEEELTEEERKAAWDEFKADKEGLGGQCHIVSHVILMSVSFNICHLMSVSLISVTFSFTFVGVPSQKPLNFEINKIIEERLGNIS